MKFKPGDKVKYIGGVHNSLDEDTVYIVLKNYNGAFTGRSMIKIKVGNKEIGYFTNKFKLVESKSKKCFKDSII